MFIETNTFVVVVDIKDPFLRNGHNYDEDKNIDKKNCDSDVILLGELSKKRN